MMIRGWKSEREKRREKERDKIGRRERTSGGEHRLRAFVYSSCHVYCNKMRAYALYGIQP